MPSFPQRHPAADPFVIRTMLAAIAVCTDNHTPVWGGETLAKQCTLDVSRWHNGNEHGPYMDREETYALQLCRYLVSTGHAMTWEEAAYVALTQYEGMEDGFVREMRVDFAQGQRGAWACAVLELVALGHSEDRVLGTVREPWRHYSRAKGELRARCGARAQRAIDQGASDAAFILRYIEPDAHRALDLLRPREQMTLPL